MARLWIQCHGYLDADTITQTSSHIVYYIFYTFVSLNRITTMPLMVERNNLLCLTLLGLHLFSLIIFL